MTELSAARDLSPTKWIVAAVRTFGESVLSLVPSGFPAYVRVFHPAWRVDEGGMPTALVRWEEVAAANGTVANPGMQVRALTRAETYDYNLAPQPGVYDVGPEVGSLPADSARALARVLARHTGTPERCWFAVWDGFGATRSDVRGAPTFHLPARDYFLLAGPIEAASESALDGPGHQSPNLWWPDDRAWCVASEIDLDTTYIGCSEACRDEILAETDLETFAVDPATGIDCYSDPLNVWNTE